MTSPTATPAAVEHHQEIPKAGAGKRAAGIEWLRVIACIGIVWFHTHAPGARLGYGGLPALMAVSVALAARPTRRATAKILRVRADRLLLPWVFWSAVYAVQMIRHARAAHTPLNHVFSPRMFLTGTAVHLWFLPFAFVVTCIVGCVYARLDHPKSRAEQWGWISISIVSLAVAAWAFHAGLRATPWMQWAFVTPSIWLGLAMARGSARGPQFIQMGLATIAIVAVCVATSLIGWKELAIPYIAAMCALFIAYLYDRPAGPITIWAGSLAYGVYIIHPLLIPEVHHFIHQTVLLAICVSILSILISAVLKLTPLRAVI